MRLIVLDTNVLVSAGIREGSPPHRIVNDYLLEHRIQAVACPLLVQEYLDVCARPKFSPYGFPPPWLTEIIDGAISVPDPKPWPHPLPDPPDQIFLAVAKSAGAWLITGNLKHFPPDARAGVAVLSPGEYLTRLEDAEKGGLEQEE